MATDTVYGLATRADRKEAVEALFSVKRRWTAFEVAGMTPLGYHDESPAPETRKELSKIVRYERWE